MAHILVVEDDADISRLLCRILSKEDMRRCPPIRERRRSCVWRCRSRI